MDSGVSFLALIQAIIRTVVRKQDGFAAADFERHISRNDVMVIATPGGLPDRRSG